MGQKKPTLDSTKSRDHEEYQHNLPVTAMPTIDALVTVRPQIIFFQQSYFDEIGNTPTYVANATYSAQSFLNSSITVSTLHMYEHHFYIGINNCKNFVMMKSAAITLSIRI